MPDSRAFARLRRFLFADKVLALAGAAAMVHLALGLPWCPGLLLASLLVLTGPTASPGRSVP